MPISELPSLAMYAADYSLFIPKSDPEQKRAIEPKSLVEEKPCTRSRGLKIFIQAANGQAAINRKAKFQISLGLIKAVQCERT